MKQFLILVLSVVLFSCNSKKESTNTDTSLSTLASATDVVIVDGFTHLHDLSEEMEGFVWKSFTFKPAPQQPQHADFPQVGEMCSYLNGLQRVIGEPFFNRTLEEMLSIDQERTHRTLLGIDGVSVDIIAMVHTALDPDDQGNDHALLYQKAITRLVQGRGYDIVIVEDFYSSPNTPVRITKDGILYQVTSEIHNIASYLREPMPSQDMLEKLADSMEEQSAAAWLVEHAPDVEVYGGDYAPVKKMQRHLMALDWMPSTPQHIRNRINTQFRTLSRVRDLNFAEQVVILSREHPGKRIAIIIGVGHTQNLVGLMSRYGARGHVILEERLYDTYIGECRDSGIEIIEHQ